MEPSDEQPNDTIKNDLASLRHLELPQDHDSNLVKFSVLLICVAIVAAVIGLIYSVIVLSGDKGDLQDQLTCFRESSVEYEKRIGEGVSLLVELDLRLSDALIAVGTQSEEDLAAALQGMSELQEEGRVVQGRIDQAIAARENAADQCK
jgi:hypothetical protein